MVQGIDADIKRDILTLKKLVSIIRDASSRFRYYDYVQIQSEPNDESNKLVKVADNKHLTKELIRKDDPNGPNLTVR